MFENVVRPSVLTCRDYIPGKPVEEVQREFGLSDILKLASNENPMGVSPKAAVAMCKAVIDQSQLYPESLAVDLVNKLAKKHNFPAKQILTGNGLDNVITMLGMVFINQGDEVIFGNLSFPGYGNITRKMGGVCVETGMTEDERIDIDAIIKAVTPKTKMIFLCNPNNPTGTINTKAECLKLIESVPSNVIIVFDNAYCDFVESPDYSDMLEYIDKYPNILSLFTFSKIYGMAAERVGYAIGNEEIIYYAGKVREPFPVNRIAQLGAIAALDDKEFYEASQKNNYEGRHYLYDEFEKMGLKYYDSQTNFVYVEVPKPAQDVFQAMLPLGVIVRPMAGQGRPHGLRITIGTPDQNKRMLETLKKVLAD